MIGVDEMPRVNINISDELKEYFEKKAKETGATQSSIMSIYLAEYVEMKETMNKAYEMVQFLKDNPDINSRADKLP